MVGVKHHLCNTITVADIDKSHSAHFPAALHPTGNLNSLSGIGEPEFAACLVSIHIGY